MVCLHKRIFCFFLTLLCLVLLAGCGHTHSQENAVYGKITAIDGNAVTVALGTVDESAQQPQGTPPAENQQPQGAPPADGQAPETSPPVQPDGTDPATSSPPADGQPPQQGGGQPVHLELSGEEATYMISDESILKVGSEQQSAALSDLQVGMILKITLSGATPSSIEIIGGMGGAPDSSASPSPSIEGTAAYQLNTGSQSLTEQSLSAVDANQSAVKVTGGALSLTNMQIHKTGDTTSDDESNFYGLNAGVLATNGTITLQNSTIETNANGANAVFAMGTSASIPLSDCTIHTTGDSSRGLDATYGGTITASHVNITTQGAHCAALATDRGEGTIDVTGGTMQTSGEGSPGIYSTGSITVRNATLTATGSEAAVVEGKNSITLENSTLTCAKNAGVMLYQSTSGDAREGTSIFTMTGGSLTAQSGPLFYITNTDSVIHLQQVALQQSSGVLLSAKADRWGNSGSNGGHVTLNAISQTLQGDVQCDSVSSVSFNLTQSSSLTGSIDAAHTAQSIVLSLDASSAWNVTGDSYLSALTNADSACSNIQSNGHTVYYDAANTANAWLNGQTLSLPGGGFLCPISERRPCESRAFRFHLHKCA